MNRHNNYCPAIIDIEASGFGALSYPIEIGVITAKGNSYCRLITPLQDWTFWDQQAARVHNIDRATLSKYGTPVTTVASELNQLLRGGTVHSDGWVVDKPWLIMLFHRARIPMEFSISPLENVLSEGQMDIWHDTKNEVAQELGLQRHRASTDAKIIQETYVRTRQIAEMTDY